MGVVYRAEDTKLHRQVALKFLPDELTKDPTALERFQLEVHATSALNHPNICTIHDIDEETGQTVIELEPVTTGASGDAMYLTLFADGKRLAYGIRDTRANIMKVEFTPSTRTVVGEPAPVTEGSRLIGAVEVSPDGESLNFHRVGV